MTHIIKISTQDHVHINVVNKYSKLLSAITGILMRFRSGLVYEAFISYLINTNNVHMYNGIIISHGSGNIFYQTYYE